MIVINDKPTLSDVDEALRNLSLVPVEDRGAAWYAYSDRVLELRSRLESLSV